MHQTVHIITPGDHFSPSTGSAIPTIVHNLSTVSGNRGCSSAVVVDSTTRKERYSSATIIECAYNSFRLTNVQKVFDIVCGRMIGFRQSVAKLYYPAVNAISGLEQANVIVHNAVPHPTLLRRIAPQHFYYAWLNNDILRFYSRRERTSLASSYDGIICCSDYIRNVTIAGLPLEFHNRFHVVQNGVDLAHFGVVRHFQSKVTILFIGRVVYEKGVHVLIDAVVDLKNRGYDFNVRIVGRCGFDNNDALSPYELKLRESASNCDSVEFLPFARREEIPIIMANADILVVPSIWPDPNPLVVKEGLAAGLAVVCSDIGGIPEMFQDKSMLFSPGDTNALANILTTLLEDTHLIRVLGDNNRLEVQRFAWDKQLDILNEILG